VHDADVYCFDTAVVSFSSLQVILYTFPAICWAYGAGFVFSAFVSVVFWGGPALQLLELVRLHSATVRPSLLTPASEVSLCVCCCVNILSRVLLVQPFLFDDVLAGLAGCRAVTFE
jgi:hypothetical protein